MKKILALMLALVMVLALAACGSSTTETAAEDTAAADEAAAPAEEAAVEEAAPAEEAPAAEAGDASGEMASASGEMASDESASAESGAQSGNALDLSVNETIPTEAEPETYTADEDGWKQYMLDCAYYAMGTSDSDNKLGSTYYDIMNDGMTDMFVNMWGVDNMETFIANGGVPTVNPWTLAEGLGTPETVPDETTETAE